MIKDRGNIKWTSLMLVEHRKKLEEIWEHREDVEKPVLDDQEKERLGREIKKAIKNKGQVEIKYYQNKRIRTYKGFIKSVNTNNKKIILQNGREKMYLSLSNIINVKLT